jgi:multidrug efflux pump
MKDAKSYFTDLFVQRPVLAIVVNLVIVIAGIQAVITAISGKGDFTVRQYPKSENSAITITTSYLGANAELIRGYITSPIERSIASADGIDYIESTSSQNLSRITARLKLNHNPVDALSEISAKVDQIRADLPPQSQAPVLNIESADSRFAAIYLSFKSDLLKPNEVTDYLVRVVQPSFTAIPGVQKAGILGARTFAMRIWLDPKKLAAYNLSPSDIRDALIQNNALASVGKTRGNYIQINLNANTDLKSVQQFKNLVVLENNNSIVKLGEIANVLLGAENYDIDVRFAGENAVFMGIWVLPTANSLNVIEKVRDQTELLKENFPTGFYGNIAYDSTHYIDNAIDEVVKTLIETILIVIVVIFLFLGSLRSVLVPVIVIPVSLIGSIFLMQIFGFSINLLTLLAIVLAVGLVVDDAIVVVENVERHLEEGMKPFDAAFIGARELIGPIIATTITLAAVYAPIAFQEGLTGTLFREFTITLAGAVVISSIVALTLSPMMSSKILKTSDSKSGFSNKVNGFFDRLKDKYQNKIESTLKNRPLYYFIWILLTLSLLPPLYIFFNDQGIGSY